MQTNPRNPLRALAPLLLVAFTASTAEAANHNELISRGEVADVYKSPRDPWKKVWKVMRPAVWKNDELRLLSGSDRKSAAESAAWAAETLRKNSAFTLRFGKIVPTTKVTDRHGWIEQSVRHGVPFDWLSGDLKDKAKKEYKEAIEMARMIVGEVDEDRGNFVFESWSGKISGWLSVKPLPKGSAVGLRRIRELGAGANARVFEVRASDPKWSHLEVLKILKPYAPSRFPKEAPEPVLEALSKEAAHLAKVLRADDEFRKRFGNVVPDTIEIAPGVILQERARGVPFEHLGFSKEERARKDVDEAIAMAKKLLPGVVLSHHMDNFMFDPEKGKISSWFDVPADGPRSYEKAGVAERFYSWKAAAAPAHHSK